ncbi:MAG: Stk1 family PASTA domain-containing Ser/Thr kinase [Nocardioidaceae bacterium]
MTTEGPEAWEGEPMPGPSRLGGRYELGALLGQGGMAVVRQATDLRLGRTVAVKILRGELTEAPSFQARFRREARAAAALDHPAIVGVYDAGEETVDGVVTLYIVMEYVDGQTLRHLVQRGPLAPDRALGITADILDALAHSHRAGLVHRDVKPANVMVTPAGAVKVMDFGVARAVADMSASLTQTSAVIGTAHYLSPEQARGDSVDARSDVYSTGCLLYELLTGRPPFHGDSAISVAYQHVREEPQPPSAFEPSVPAEIEAVVLAALAKQPGQRYQSAEEMRSDLLGVLAGDRAALPVAAVESTADLPPVADATEATAVAVVPADPDAGVPDDSVDRRQRRRKIGYVVAAVAIVLAGVLAAFAMTGLGDEPDRRPEAEQKPVRDREPDRSAQPRAQSGPLAPAGSTDSGPVERRQPAPRDRGATQPKQTADDTRPEQSPGPARPEPTQDSEPSPTATSSSAPAESASASQESSPSESPPPESSEPEQSPTTEPTPTAPPAAQDAGA